MEPPEDDYVLYEIVDVLEAVIDKLVVESELRLRLASDPVPKTLPENSQRP